MSLFKNKYRIASARAPWWDYGRAAPYFITICTMNRENYLGDITDGKMQLSKAGVLADVLWHQIPQHAQNVELGAFVVMPNHIHGILTLNGHDGIDDRRDKACLVSTGSNGDPVEPPAPLSPSQQRFRNPGKNTVSSIIGGYKSAVSRHANRLGIAMGWQSRFHDHIIRNDAEYQRINDYIESNPQNWNKDKFFQ